MKRLLLRFVTTLLIITNMSVAGNSQTAGEKSSSAIRAVLDAQRDAWNKGDIEGFMDGYDRSDNTVFVSGDNVTRGWKTVMERYKKNYDTPEKMGQLTFSDLEVNMLSKDTAVVIGKWLLKRSTDEPHGRFTLIFKKTGHGWRIIHDHTSSA
ncbi:MAG TPA: nuclear transport factor 2 family protein [Pyrinomonadaceae bacterium]|nr:nuclear transport factor 2 family protein [Pyrinomonadaceae bacterium]